MLNDIKTLASSLWARVLVTREDGQAMVEYGLILALISVVAIIALAAIGTNVNEVFNEVGNKLGEAL
jgi:pilus assembly protein Flp/PilA